MKERFNIDISGIQFAIVSGDGEELVRKAEADVIKSVDGICRQNKNLSKLDAVAIAALDYCGELLKAEAKIKNLEAQIEILEANMQRKREDAPAEPMTLEEPAPAEEEPCAEEPAPAADPAPAEETVAEEPAAPAESADDADDGSRDQKFRQLEALLGSQLKFDIDN